MSSSVLLTSKRSTEPGRGWAARLGSDQTLGQICEAVHAIGATLNLRGERGANLSTSGRLSSELAFSGIELHHGWVLVAKVDRRLLRL